MQSNIASGAETLTTVLDRASDRGFSTPFAARSDGLVQCGACRRQVNPAGLAVTAVDRLEGASDAADLLMVVWATCPSCGGDGVLTLGYGPNASEADLEVTPHIDVSAAGPSTA